MQDLVYIAATFAFFALAILFVIACDKLIGPDELAMAEEGGGESPEPEALEEIAA